MNTINTQPLPRMVQAYTVLFPRQSDHCGFLTWLAAFEQEQSIDSRARIGFVRDQLTPIFSRVTFAPPSEQADTIRHAATAFNAQPVA